MIPPCSVSTQQHVEGERAPRDISRGPVPTTGHVKLLHILLVLVLIRHLTNNPCVCFCAMHASLLKNQKVAAISRQYIAGLVVPGGFAAGAANSNNHSGGFNGDGRVEPTAAAATTIPAVTITPVATTPVPPLVVDSSPAAAAGGVSSSNVIAVEEGVEKKVDKEPEERL